VVPLLVLVVNLNFASFQLQKYWNEVTIGLHLFGNPIHTMWALLTKLDVKRRIEIRCQDRLLKIGLAQTDISTYSTLLYSLDDFNFSRDFQDHFEQLMGIAASGREDLQNACRGAPLTSPLLVSTILAEQFLLCLDTLQLSRPISSEQTFPEMFRSTIPTQSLCDS
jgi:hypothetical protein